MNRKMCSFSWGWTNNNKVLSRQIISYFTRETQVLNSKEVLTGPTHCSICHTWQSVSASWPSILSFAAQPSTPAEKRERQHLTKHTTLSDTTQEKWCVENKLGEIFFWQALGERTNFYRPLGRWHFADSKPLYSSRCEVPADIFCFMAAGDAFMAWLKWWAIIIPHENQ